MSKVIGLLLTVLVTFGMSLLLIPTMGIVFGLLKKWMVQ